MHRRLVEDALILCWRTGAANMGGGGVCCDFYGDQTGISMPTVAHDFATYWIIYHKEPY